MGGLGGVGALLLTWQRRINLISPSTIPSLWTRHVADSLQLLQLAAAHPSPSLTFPREQGREVGGDGREGAGWLAVGSVGGFPGIVLGCLLLDVSGTTIRL